MTRRKGISLVAAMAANRAIGIDGRLPWHLPADLKHFKALTMGQTLVMGRKTYESLRGPLPWRTTIVITRQPDYAPPGVLVAHSLDEALALAEGTEGEEVFVAGGEEIFRLALDVAGRIYLTRIDKDFPGDTFFPELGESSWTVVEREDFPATEQTPAFSFLTLDRALTPGPSPDPSLPPSPGEGRKAGPVLAVLAFLAVLAACDRSPLQDDRRSTETIRKATIYLIADPLEEDCGGTATPYEVELGSPSPALGGTVEALLSLGDRSDGSGFYNALAHSPLKIEKVERSGPAVRIYLTGYLELGGGCDASRVLSQLTETAVQFSDVETAEFFLDGKPLKELLSEQG